MNKGQGYLHIFDNFISKLKKSGVDEGIINKLLVVNPTRILDNKNLLC